MEILDKSILRKIFKNQPLGSIGVKSVMYGGIDRYPYPGIFTISKRFIRYDEPKSNVYSIYDIAHSLSQICRFTGHTNTTYTVAHHSLIVASLCPPTKMLEALMHDAPEAYLCDVNTPLKNYINGEYKRLEKKFKECIERAFKLNDTEDDTISSIDKAVTRLESMEFLGIDCSLGGWVPDLDIREILNIPNVKWAFLNAFTKLNEERKRYENI